MPCTNDSVQTNRTVEKQSKLWNLPFPLLQSRCTAWNGQKHEGIFLCTSTSTNFQVWNVVTISKWLHQCPTEDLWKQHESVRNLRALAVSLTSHAEDRLPKEETFSNLPEYIDVLSCSHNFCEAIKADQVSADPFEVQRALIVGFQVYLPPLRGKPFWSLDLSQDGENNSMLDPSF